MDSAHTADGKLIAWPPVFQNETRVVHRHVATPDHSRPFRPTFSIYLMFPSATRHHSGVIHSPPEPLLPTGCLPGILTDMPTWRTCPRLPMPSRRRSRTPRRWAPLAAALGLIPLSLALAGYVDPTSGEPVPRHVLRPFDKPEHNWEPGHRGVDLALPVGGAVRAAGSGTVSFAGVVAGRPSVSIDHPDGLRSTYTPVFARVRVGDAVAEGDVIGTLGQPFDGMPGLHWGVLQGKDDYIDPLSLLDAPVIRLKPVDS